MFEYTLVVDPDYDAFDPYYLKHVDFGQRFVLCHNVDQSGNDYQSVDLKALMMMLVLGTIFRNDMVMLAALDVHNLVYLDFFCFHHSMMWLNEI